MTEKDRSRTGWSALLRWVKCWPWRRVRAALGAESVGLCVVLRASAVRTRHQDQRSM